MSRAPLAFTSISISPRVFEPNIRVPVMLARRRAPAHSSASRISALTSLPMISLRRLTSWSASPEKTRELRSFSRGVSGYFFPTLRSSYACFILMNLALSPPRSEWTCRASLRKASRMSFWVDPSSMPSMS